jgi:ADP-ribose pyrophosphatase
MTSKKKTGKSTSKNAATAGAEAAIVSSLPLKAASPSKTAKPAKPAKPAGKTVETKIAKKAAAAKDSKATKAKPSSAETAKAPRKPKAAGKLKTAKTGQNETAKILDSRVAYEGPLFRVLRDHIIEPGGRESHRDVIRHNGSVVILAVDHGKHKHGKHKKDPWIVIERQYRHAAGQFLWELPAGKLDAGETPVDGAKRELAEETGYQAKEWSALVEYYASPGFLGESMKVFLAEELIAGDAHPEEDEHIDFRLVKLSDLLEMVDKGKIVDGKTLTTILLYARQLGIKRKK